MKNISGYSKLSKSQKIDWVVENYLNNDETAKAELISFWHQNSETQKTLDEFSENTITNYFFPFSVAPNFLINQEWYCLPMAIEESSVVAAMSNAGKFWSERGGFHADVISTTKIGQVHFKFSGNKAYFKSQFPTIKTTLYEGAKYLSVNMDARGGGVTDIELIDMTQHEQDYFQLKVSFETCDSMGANFINTILEEYASQLKEIVNNDAQYSGEIMIIMSIVSNFTPDCLVRAWVECKVEDLGNVGGVPAHVFAEKVRTAVKIAEVDPHRATTHNKGIYNGVDAIIIATGNDFRAVEACGHTYAARNGQYASLTHCTVENGIFRFWIDLPLAVGTVGGLTQLHPLVKRSMQILGNPNAQQLMMFCAVAGLAQNFAALKAMTTVGIQQGHMKMHLLNILNYLKATEEEKVYALEYFKDKIVSFTTTRVMLEQYRSAKNVVK
ncbi:MAG TPA: hydroxymethylglutaryl-CoA reductase [Chitinophagales bacterium]|jgi:hydroxymethylglutaryl-CoA reductase|nr:hydroxymethylglutaryl-CoA reductase [Chitinophagales bacterium]HQV77065.1 hydroxymethylglutaryl-CoA reductase [Chitinophagales bacterium]HQW77868.1 hydroxymethylglutaryl-CoA reductase [Chitinophagales bacterium]